MKKERIKCKHCDADIFALECPACGGAYPITEKILEQQPEVSEGKITKAIENFITEKSYSNDNGAYIGDADLFEDGFRTAIEWLQSLNQKGEGWIELLKEFNEWQNETFPQQDVHGKIAHLTKEVKELKVALLVKGEDNKREEFAHCFMIEL